jgi:hypothetical protein
MEEGLEGTVSRPEDQQRWFAISVLGDIESEEGSPEIETFDPDGVFPKGQVAVIRKASDSDQNGFGFWFNDNPDQILAILISEDQGSGSTSIKALAKFGGEAGICRLGFGPGSREVFDYLKENGFEK